MTELEKALQTSSDSAPGFDNITYSMLANLPLNIRQILLTAFNLMWTNDEDVPDLKNIVTVPILKPNSNSDLPNLYRPISLLPCILKIYEKVIKSRLEWWIEENNILPSYQYGFRKGMSTRDALTDFVTNIKINLSENRFISSVFLDIKNAYNCVDLDILQDKLIKLGIPSKAAGNIVQLYRDRKIYVRMQNNELYGPKTCSLGLPQGSILSPILFNLYMSDFPTQNTIHLLIVCFNFTAMVPSFM